MSIVFELSIGLHFEWVGGNGSQGHFLLSTFVEPERRWKISDTTSIRTIRNGAIFRLFFVPFVSWLDTSFLVPLHNVSTHTVDHVPCLELFHISQGDLDASFLPIHKLMHLGKTSWAQFTFTTTQESIKETTQKGQPWNPMDTMHNDDVGVHQTKRSNEATRNNDFSR